MQIRRLENREHGDTRALYEEIFTEDEKAFVDYYYTEKTEDNQIYVVEEDGGIQAMLHLNPYTLKVNGMEKQANYIVAVATREAYRKRGYMGSLMRQALRDMYKEGQLFTFLMPASEAIYLPYDFRTVYEQERRSCLEKSEEEQGGKEAADADCAGLSEAAEKYLAAHYQVYARRDEAYYKRLLKELASDGSKLMIFRDGDNITDCRFRYGTDAIGEEKPKIMVRMIDVRRMLMSLRLRSFMGACFTVTDPVIEENNRCVVITGTEFSGVMLMEGSEENSEGTITAAALASFLFGAKTVREIAEEDGVRMSERLCGELEKIIPLSKIYLNEVV